MQFRNFRSLFLLPFRGWGFFILLLLHTAASYYYISQQNITFDEPQYIEYAKRWLHGKPERVRPLDDSKSPVIAVCWLPRIVRQIIQPNYHLNDYGRKDQQEGRYMMILFSLISAVYAYRWCKEWYGEKGWWLPLLLLLFDPLYLAYSTIITTDLTCGTFLIAVLYHFRKYLISRKQKQFYAAAVCTGLGIITKQSMLFVIILLPVLSVIYFLITKRERSYLTTRSFYDVLVFSLIVILVINLSYYFYNTFIPFGNYSFESHSFRNMQHRLSFLHWLPVPLPEPYIQSLDMIKAHAEFGAGKPGSTFNAVYLFGESKVEGGFWYYYLVILFYKMPIGTMLLFLASLILFVKKFRLKVFGEKYMFLIIPVIFYGIILSFFNQFQIGIRHILLVFPLLYIGLGKLFFDLANSRLTYKMLTAGAVAYTFISVAMYYPYIIPYTNEFIINKKTVYTKILDSSIDYGQSDSDAATFIASHPGYKKLSSIPAPGKYAITMDLLLNSNWREKISYTWYQKLEPADVYHYVILLYDIKDEDLVKAGLLK